MKIYFHFILFFVLITISKGTTEMSHEKNHLIDMLPQKLNGWKIEGEDQVYNENNLYEYINGGAELFLSYKFQKGVSRIYSAPEQPDIIIDIFDMANSANAFGVFSHSREQIDSTFGQGSQYTAGLLLFWKDRYYVSILASPETEESKRAVFKLARIIDQAIDKKGPVPNILKLIPQDSLVEESIRYFRHYIWLNSYYFISNKNILHINDDTEAVLAKYGNSMNRYFLLLIQYPNSNKVHQAKLNFVKNYLPELSQHNFVQHSNEKWVGLKLKNEYLILGINAPTRNQLESLINDTIKNIDKWHPKRGK